MLRVLVGIARGTWMFTTSFPVTTLSAEYSLTAGNNQTSYACVCQDYLLETRVGDSHDDGILRTANKLAVLWLKK